MAHYGIDRIKKILPHREPMLFIDEVLESSEDHITALRTLRADEPFFAGHFPGNPVFPGVLQVETLAQAGALLASAKTGYDDVWALLTGVDKTRFRNIIRAGDTLHIEASVIQQHGRLWRFAGKITVNGIIATETELTCMVLSPDRVAVLHGKEFRSPEVQKSRI